MLRSVPPGAPHHFSHIMRVKWFAMKRPDVAPPRSRGPGRDESAPTRTKAGKKEDHRSRSNGPERLLRVCVSRACRHTSERSRAQGLLVRTASSMLAATRIARILSKAPPFASIHPLARGATPARMITIDTIKVGTKRCNRPHDASKLRPRSWSDE